MPTREFHHPFGSTGLILPPIVFSAAPLANVRRVIPDQTKLELVGEWLKHVSPPVVVEIAEDEGAEAALGVFRRAIAQFQITPQELVVSLRFGHNSTLQQVQSLTDECRRSLGQGLAPQLVSVSFPLNEMDASGLWPILELLRGWKDAGQIRAIGICTADYKFFEEAQAQTPLDWVTLSGCLTILRHPAEALALAARLHAQGIPIVNASVLHSGFFTGVNELDGRPLKSHDDADQRILAWRKSFVALCHGHGILPTHAAIQFAFRRPGVHAVRVTTSHPDRVRENVVAITAPISPNFWDSMREEGLLEDDGL